MKLTKAEGDRLDEIEARKELVDSGPWTHSMYSVLCSQLDISFLIALIRKNLEDQNENQP